MKYDFDKIIDRRGKDSVAVDLDDMFGIFNVETKEGFDQIPLWIADMNFDTVPTIPEAMIERAKHPLYGYFAPREEYFSAIIDWQKRQNGVTDLKPEHIGYQNGVLGGVISALRILCSEGDGVLVNSPLYIGYTEVLENNGFDIVCSDLKLDKSGIWRMDLEDMEKKIVEKKIHAAIMCSPHNPCGRVWEKWELEKVMELYKKHDVFVISDEIWSDLTLPGYQHIPTQSVSEDAKGRTIALYAPSKTFNLAGLVGSYSIIYNTYLKDRFEKQSSLSAYNNMNLLSMYALIGAYKEEGHEWLTELRAVMEKNIDYAIGYIDEHFSGVSVAKPQGTYMLFIDCEDWCREHGRTMDELVNSGVEYGIMWQDGRIFRGPYAIRLNLALPYSRVKEAFERMDKYVFNK